MGDMSPQAVRFAPRLMTWQLRRPHLVSRIEDGLADGLVILRGGAGAGKTALLTEWAHTTGRRGTWIALDDASSTRAALWSRVLGALGHERAAAAASGVEAGTAHGLRAALRTAFGEDEHVLVLDEYQHAHAADIHDDIAWLVQNTRCGVVVATRVRDGLDAPLLATRLAATLLTTEDLRLAPAESASMLTRAGVADTESHRIAYEELEGWPFGTRALELELGRAEGDLHESLAHVARMVVSAGSALPTALADPEVLRFAARLALADSVGADLARTLAPHADRLLGVLESEGLGTWVDGAAGVTFRLQSFVQTAVSSRTDVLDRAEVAATRRALAAWGDRNGNAVLAGRQAVALGDWGLLADFSQRHFRQIMRLHRSEWGRLLAQVPLDQLRRHPVLGSVHLQVLNADSGATARMRAIATVLLQSFGPLRERGGMLDRIWRNSSVLAAERVTGRYAAARTTAERLDGHIGSLSPEEYAAIEDLLPVLWTHIGTTRLYTGESAGAVAAYDEALRAESDAPWLRLHALSMSAFAAAFDGDLPRAGTLSDAVERHTPIPGWRGTYSASGYHLTRAMQRLEAFDSEGAEREVATLDAHFETIEHWPLVLWVRALIAIVDGTPAAAASRLPGTIRVRARRTQTSTDMRSLLTAVHGDLMLASGDANAAERLLAQSDERDSAPVLATSARAALARGDDLRAISLAVRLAGVKGVSPRHLGDGMLVRAIADHRLGRRADATRSAERALQVLAAGGMRFPLALVPRAPLRELLAELGPQGRSALSDLDGVPELIPYGDVSANLTTRELAVLAQLEATASTKLISEALHVSPNTVKTQLRSLYRKLDASTREEALRAAYTQGLLAPRR